MPQQLNQDQTGRATERLIQGKINQGGQQFTSQQLDKKHLSLSQDKEFRSRSLKSQDSIKNVYLEEIDNTKSQIHGLLQQLNNKLVINYQVKQKQLLLKYKDQLIAAHKNLTDLKNNTNQHQIRNQMNQRKLQLQKERLQLIQNNMYFSNKCEQLKKILQNQINQSAQIKKQISFLDKQLQHSALKKIELMGRLYQKNNQLSKISIQQKYTGAQLPLFSQKKIQAPIQTQKKTSLSTYSNTYTLTKSKSNSQTKFKDSIKKPLFSKDIKKIFEDKLQGSNQNASLQVSDNLMKLGNTLTKRTIISKQRSASQISEVKKTQIGEIFNQIVSQVKKKTYNPTKQEVLMSKGEEFTQTQKKMIMKNFLQNQQVKKQLYSVIFDKLNQNEFPMTLRKKSKIKIAYENSQRVKQEQNTIN